MLKNLFFSDPGEDAIITGRIHRGGLVQASGETENFVLINNNDSPAFWIKKLDVVQTNNEEKSKFIDAKIISEYESPPTMEIKTQILEDKNKAKIVSLIKDDTNLRSVNYFINGKKIRLVAEGKRNINETFGIQLEPGRNKLSVMAIDKKNIKVFEDFFITSYEK